MARHAVSLPVVLAVLACGDLVTAERPNIVFLLTDDQRADTLGCMGNTIIRTPHIDRLGREGVIFDNAFVTTAICMTNRACIFTGQYAARHGINDFRTELSPGQLARTYPGLLKTAGYRTGFIGKWGVGNPPEDVFDYNRGFPGQGRFVIEKDGKERHLTSVLGDQALEFLAGCTADRPFCLSISFKAPHVQDGDSVNYQPFPYDPALGELYRDVRIPVPETAAPEYFERLPVFLKDSENRARWAVRFWGPARYQESVKSYYRLISGVDIVVGRVREALAKHGFAGDTVIIFTSDHGFYLGEYGFAGKWYPHEVSIRVPMIVHDPRVPAAARAIRREQIALSIDIAPTILDYAGVDVPASMQGASLAPLASDAPPGSWRTEFFYEHHFAHARIPRSEGVRTPRWKYLRYLDSRPLHEELYDLENDPREKENLASAPDHAQDLATLRAAWEKWRERVR